MDFFDKYFECMKNIFENAKFGDMFKTRNGRRALFCTASRGVLCFVEDCGLIPYHPNGISYGASSADIVGRLIDDHGWIPVTEDTMPECLRIDDEKRSKQLLFLTRDKQIHYGIYSYYPIGEWCSEDGSLDEDIPCSSGEVTHWMPLPKSPASEL